jgi:hypothetical protein
MKSGYEIREENGSFAVYKNGKFVKSFNTRKEAEDYIEKQTKHTPPRR